MRILLTGAAGHTARALLPALLQHPLQPRILAVDIRPTGLWHPRLESRIADLRSLPWPELLEEIDTVIHLAFVVLCQGLGPEKRWRAEMAAVNRQGTLTLLRAAARAGVRQFLYGSSVSVYGAWPDNPLGMEENHPLRPVPGFAYGEDKAAVERCMDALEGLNPEMALCRLRLHAIVGPDAQPLVNRIATSPWSLRLPNPELPLQCVHQDDAVSAFLGAWEQGARGTFNIAADRPVPWSTIPRKWHLPISPGQLHHLHRAIRPVTRILGDPGWLPGLQYPLIVDTRRAKTVLGWKARYSVAEAIESARGRSSREE